MYKSPIEIICGQIKTQIDGDIYSAVQSYDIKVDKHELLRALQYDRGQYEKGYADALKSVVRCGDCVHSQPLDRNCEISVSLYMHCGLLRGEETKNVWHKYKKYYKDYSIVERDDYCSYGERKAK